MMCGLAVRASLTKAARSPVGNEAFSNSKVGGEVGPAVSWLSRVCYDTLRPTVFTAELPTMIGAGPKNCKGLARRFYTLLNLSFREFPN